MQPSAQSTPAVHEAIRPATFLEPIRLARKTGIELIIASETFQHTGSFKFRAACHLAANIPQTRVITASSGNFGQALAYACHLFGKTALVVMPDTSAQVKIEAVREYGGTVDLIDLSHRSRQQRVQELALNYPEAYLASPYDDPLVIAGNASLGWELARFPRPFDAIIAPVGGGGLISGIIQGLQAASSKIPVYGAEPLLANDAAQSLRAGRLVAHERESQTMADGVRTSSLGRHTWPILRNGLRAIIEIPEENIRESLRQLFLLANLKVEPTGALAFAALLTQPNLFHGQRVCCIASGGNVDPALFLSLL